MLKAREERHPVLIRGRMRAGGPSVDVCVRNISRNGMMLQAHEAPPMGSYVEVQLPDQVVVGRVMWSNERRFGIRTRERVSLLCLLGLAKGEGTTVERMARACSPAGRARHGDARDLGRAAQFVMVICIVVGMAVAIAAIGYQTLARLSAQVTSHL